MGLTVKYGGKRGREYTLEPSTDMIVVRSENYHLPGNISLTARARRALDQLTAVVDVPDAGVQVFAARRGRPASAGRARLLLKKEKDVRFAGRALRDSKSKSPIIYTENLFVKFHDNVPKSECDWLLKKYKLSIKREIKYAKHAYFAAAREGIGTKVFDLAMRLLDEENIELCHPELVRHRSLRVAFVEQWHLKKTTINNRQIDAHANVEAAWAVSQGEGVTVAVIDDGFDRSHEEFKGARKVTSPRDVTRRTNDPSPGARDMHGHACAGVACANGNYRASGVAPKATLMPIRLNSALGSQNEADAFAWAVANGADVISCSWGPADGNWWNASDPAHKEVTPLPDSTRLAIHHAVTNGRSGKGCVILWAAGNGNESVDNDGYAANPDVIAVAACNDMGKRSVYSDKGRAIWCSFPSNDGYPSLTPGIWTTDLSGPAGYNNGNIKMGDVKGNYTNSFGGTSSATPGAAGVAALILSKNPTLTYLQVRDILKRCCDRIDKTGARYDFEGHSKLYGYGRLNAKRAVDLA
jgi:subtilisin family serine protease